MRNLFLKSYKNISVQTALKYWLFVKLDILDFLKIFFQILCINYKFSQDLLTFFYCYLCINAFPHLLEKLK